MKKIVICILTFITLLSISTGCSKSEKGKMPESSEAISNTQKIEVIKSPDEQLIKIHN